MINFLRRLFGKQQTTADQSAPYKVEPAAPQAEEQSASAAKVKPKASKAVKKPLVRAKSARSATKK
jgi:hypothetical protein